MAEPSPRTEAAAKEALLVRFGPLAFCDPDSYPDAQGDDVSGATQHLASMRADTAAWAAIASHLGFNPSSVPNDSTLLAAYREWKALRTSTTWAGDGWRFDARFRITAGPDPSAAPSVTHVVGTVDASGRIVVDTQETSAPVRCPICLARGSAARATPAGDVAVELLRLGDPVWSGPRRTAGSSRRRPGRVDAWCRPAMRSSISSSRTVAPSSYRLAILIRTDTRSAISALAKPNTMDPSSFRPTASRTTVAVHSICCRPVGQASTGRMDRARGYAVPLTGVRPPHGYPVRRCTCGFGLNPKSGWTPPYRRARPNSTDHREHLSGTPTDWAHGPPSAPRRIVRRMP